jgi:hypothetical protein
LFRFVENRYCEDWASAPAALTAGKTADFASSAPEEAAASDHCRAHLYAVGDGGAGDAVATSAFGGDDGRRATHPPATAVAAAATMATTTHGVEILLRDVFEL